MAKEAEGVDEIKKAAAAAYRDAFVKTSAALGHGYVANSDEELAAALNRIEWAETQEGRKEAALQPARHLMAKALDAQLAALAR